MKGILTAVVTALIIFGLIFENVSGTEDTYTVAYDPNLPPLHVDKENLSGFSVEIMKEIAKRQDMTINFVPMSKKQSIEAIRNEEVDIILSMTFSDEHAEDMEFSETILSTSVGLMVPASEGEINTVSDLSGDVIALQSETLEYEFLQNIRTVDYNVAYNQITALDLLLNERADGFVGNVITTEYYLNKVGQEDSYEFVDTYLLPSEYSIVVQKENYLLLQQINQGIRELKSDGTYSTIYDQWIVDEDNQLADRLWLVIQITGGLLLVSFIIVFIGIRINRKLQHEVSKKTSVLSRLNQSLEHQIEQTKNSTEFQRQILGSSPRGIVTIDKEGLVTSINPKAYELLHWKQDWTGYSYKEVPFIEEWLQGIFTEVINGEEEQYLGVETTWEFSDRSVVYFRYYVYPLYDFTRSIVGIIFAIEDNTAEQSLRTRLFEEEKSQALNRLVAGIAHETRNPLSSIKTFVELLPHKFGSQKFQEQMVTYVPQEVDRLDQLMKGLLDYTRPKKQQRMIINVVQTLEETLILLENTILSRGMNIEKHLDVEDACLYVDKNQFKQVLINLIMNALDAMEEKKAEHALTLTVSAFLTKQDVIIMIKDEGTGFSEDAKQKAYEPFFTTKQKGTGLGLAISYQYVRDNDGNMFLYGEEGYGSTIRLAFPVVPCDEEEYA